MSQTELTPEAKENMRLQYEEIRNQLIALCERTLLPQEKWNMKDYPNLMQQTGELWAFLKCGCDFRIVTDQTCTPEEKEAKNITTNKELFIAVTHLSEEGAALPSEQKEERAKLMITSMYVLASEETLKTHPLYKPQ